MVKIFPAFGNPTPLRLKVHPDYTLDYITQRLVDFLKIDADEEVILVHQGKKLNLKGEKNLRVQNIDNLTLCIGVKRTNRRVYLRKKLAESKVLQIKEEVLKKCFTHAQKYVDKEVGGLLIGEVAEDKLQITNSVAIAEGDSVSVDLDPVKIANKAEELRNGKNYVVGWYHSHLRNGTSMSMRDILTQLAYQKLYPKTVALIIDRAKKEVEFFRIEADQLISLMKILLSKPMHGVAICLRKYPLT
ncbi:MAG: Mov34/MPN/PAD-1 family protein [Euryarchaeota archaeon]|nr:Mov34/MPN/PAD-1 family protein [Euryarchaeota archaeon]